MGVGMKAAIFAAFFFMLGMGVVLLFPHTETRLAYTGVEEGSLEQIPFEAIKVFQDHVEIHEPGIRYARVKSSSMEPAIPKGSVVFERRPHSPEELHTGMVISYHDPILGEIVMHRIVKEYVDGGVYFITQGDNNPEVDPRPVPYSAVVGYVVGNVQYVN